MFVPDEWAHVLLARTGQIQRFNPFDPAAHKTHTHTLAARGRSWDDNIGALWCLKDIRTLAGVLASRYGTLVGCLLGKVYRLIAVFLVCRSAWCTWGIDHFGGFIVMLCLIWYRKLMFFLVRPEYRLAHTEYVLSDVSSENRIPSCTPSGGTSIGCVTPDEVDDVAHLGYEQGKRLPSHWSHARNRISVCHPIGHTHGIDSVSTIPLVTRTE
jgi:hypothetical protein